MQQQAQPSSKVVLQQPGLLAGAQRQAGSLHAIAHWRVQLANNWVAPQSHYDRFWPLYKDYSSLSGPHQQL
jgi:hypothetical protein